jgi:hypothetical protein
MSSGGADVVCMVATLLRVSMDGDVQVLVLPYSGVCVQWRADGKGRVVDPQQLAAENAGTHVAAEDEWTQWIHRDGWYGRAEAPDGGDEPTWWLYYGALPATGGVRAFAPGGVELPVMTLGRIWACEWRSRKKTIMLEISNKLHEARFPGRHYR